MIALARAPETELSAFVMDVDVDAEKQDLESFGITRIFDVSLSEDQQDNPVVRAQTMANAVREFKIDVVFGLSTAKG